MALYYKLLVFYRLRYRSFEPLFFLVSGQKIMLQAWHIARSSACPISEIVPRPHVPTPPNLRTEGDVSGTWNQTFACICNWMIFHSPGYYDLGGLGH